MLQTILPCLPRKLIKYIGVDDTMKFYRQSKKKERAVLPVLLILGIAICIVTLTVSLFLLIPPFTIKDVFSRAESLRTYFAQQIVSFTETALSWIDTSEQEPVKAADTEIIEEEAIPFMESTGEPGDISSLQAEYNDPVDQIYLNMLDTSCGPMLYYHQGDIRWGDFLYGDNDPLKKYGCGPTAVAMVVNSFSDTAVDPTDIAVWSSDNGYYALHGGSYHSLIPDALEAYGLQVESVTDRSCEHASELLSSGHILVALMGRGTLTQNGHFVLFTKLLDNGNVYIADPVSYEHCTLEWDLEQLLSELKKSYDSGGPLWAVRP